MTTVTARSILRLMAIGVIVLGLIELANTVLAWIVLQARITEAGGVLITFGEQQLGPAPGAFTHAIVTLAIGGLLYAMAPGLAFRVTGETPPVEDAASDSGPRPTLGVFQRP